jgi:hypothetical protein
MKRRPQFGDSPPGKKKYGDAKGKVPQARDVTRAQTREATLAFYATPDHGRYTECSEVTMPIHANRFYALQVACFIVFALMLAGAQAKPDEQNKEGQSKAPNPAAPGADYSGMYSFLQEGEFVQITVEDQGHVIGFVSRYGDSESDGGFLDHFFKSGKLDGNQLAFTTETVHGVSFEFRGTFERGEGKSRGDEAYYVLKGTLVENTTGEAKKTSSRSRQVEMKSFPQDMAQPPSEKK